MNGPCEMIECCKTRLTNPSFRGIFINNRRNLRQIQVRELSYFGVVQQIWRIYAELDSPHSRGNPRLVCMNNITAYSGNKPHSCPQMLTFSVLGIFRNEAHILKEWIEHYLFFGAERIYLISNNSTDEYLRVLVHYIERGLVSLFDCHRDKYQVGAYMELLPMLQAETKWIGVFDLDEFIYSVDGRPIPEMLSIYGDYDAILIPWLSFGSNGYVEQPLSVVDSFVKRGEAGVSLAYLKSISKTAEIVLLHQHQPLTRNNKKVLSNGDVIRNGSFVHLNETDVSTFRLINNHYRLQSLAYFRAVKVTRPRVNERAENRAKGISFFCSNDSHWNGIEDTRLRDIRRSQKASGLYTSI